MLTGTAPSGGAGSLLGLTLTRDPNGRVTAMADSAAPLRNASFTYSDAGRLATAVGQWGADTYTWDANDNRVRADRVLGGTTTSDVATLAPGTNRLSELRDGSGVLSRSFAYTPAGNTATVTRASAPTLVDSYDARGRLIAVTSTPSGGSASTIASYSYDWREQRVSASSSGAGAVHYLYAEDGRLLAEMDAATGAMVREYVWLDTLPLAMVSGPVANPTYLWITTGNLNEPLLLTNSSGAVVSSVTRDPWGNPILLAGGAPLDLGYPGQWKDPATGLFQNWHRDYDPTLGRYAEADPLRLGGGGNLFAYVGGDPVNVTDPTGRNPVVGAIIIGGIIGFLFDLDWQLWHNGGRLDCINWNQVAWSTGFGAISGGTFEVAAPLIFKIGGKIPRIMPKRSPTSPAPKPPVAAEPPPPVSPTGPCHHICTNKNPVSPIGGGPWTPRFKELFRKAGMSMNNPLNIVRVPGHSGPHPELYHKEVFRRLTGATEGLEGEAYRNAFRSELEAMNRELQTNGSALYNLLMGL